MLHHCGNISKCEPSSSWGVAGGGGGDRTDTKQDTPQQLLVEVLNLQLMGSLVPEPPQPIESSPETTV